MRRAAFLLSALAVALAGCAAQGPDPAGTPVLPVARAAFFTADMGLAEDAPADVAAVPAGSFFQAWAAGDDYPTWRAAPAPRDVTVDNASVEVVLRVTGPVARTFRFPDVMVYAGSGDAWMTINTTATPPVLLPGEEYRYTLPLPSPAGGLWVPAGESFGLKVVPVMHQNEQADVEVLVGPDKSRASWRETPVDAPVVQAWASGSDAGEVVGSEYAGAAAPPTARHRTVVEANGTAPVLLAWLNTTQNQGVPDLDLELISPSGASLVFAGTPTPRESIRLAPFNLEGPGAYTLVTHNYGSARAAFTVEWRVGDAQAATHL